MNSLETVKAGNSVVVVALHGQDPVKRRLMEMGLIRGTTVFVRKVAPLGDPMEVSLRGFELSLSKADAALVEVR